LAAAAAPACTGDFPDIRLWYAVPRQHLALSSGSYDAVIAWRIHDEAHMAIKQERPPALAAIDTSALLAAIKEFTKLGRTRFLRSDSMDSPVLRNFI
jgi:hypothetical protein